VAGAALTERVDKAIDYLTANEEVQELVQSQSAGLIDEVIEEARERTVSADNFLEAVVRSVLRRPPRWELPEPPQEVKQQAEHTARQIHGRTLHK
jgi:dihydroneopterin aldolase